MKLVSALTVVALLSSRGATQSDEGYAGVYSDSSGSTPCVTVLPGDAQTLYIVAFPAAHTASGITGAEFRIDVQYPDGWLFLYSPPSDAEVLGQLVDAAADSVAGGANIAFQTCQTPSASGTVGLGTLQVFNLNGGETELSVKRHSQPKNAHFPCPLLVACDGPVYSKSCMSSAGGCQLKPSKSPMATSADPSIFSAVLEGQGPPRTDPPEPPFSETLHLGDSEIWVGSQQVDGPEVVCLYDGTTFSIGGLVVSFRDEPEEWPEEVTRRNYRNVPHVQQQLAQGVDIREAVRDYYAARDSLKARAYLAFLGGGLAAAQAEFLASPLVTQAETISDQTSVRVEFAGLRVTHRYRYGGTQQSAITPIQKRPREMTEWLKRRLFPDPQGGAMFLITEGGGQTMLTGALRTQARLQIEYVRSGGSLETLPEGPLGSRDATLRAIAQRGEGRR